MSPPRNLDELHTSTTQAVATQSGPRHRNRANIQEDILAQIFMLLSRNTDPDSDTQLPVWDWVHVTEVCHHWQSVATETANLWSCIDTRTISNKDRTKKFLVLSKDSSLTVTFSGSIRRFEITNLMMVLEEIRRIRHLYICFFSRRGWEAAELIPLLGHPAHRAESIELHMNCPWNAIKPQLSLPSTLPGVLRKIVLECLNVSSNLSLLSELTSLSIGSCNNLALSELFDILETSPRLSSLSLSFNEINPSTVTKSVHLPYLVSSLLDFEHISDLFDVITNIDAPNILVFRVRCVDNLTHNDIPRLNFLSKLLQRDYDFNSMFLLKQGSPQFPADKIYLNMGVDKIASLWDPRAALQVSFNTEDFDQAFLNLVDIFGRHLQRTEQLRIQDLYPLLTVDNWRTAFRTCSSVRILELGLGSEVGYEDNVNGLESLKALGVGYPTEEFEVLCRDLDHMIITWYGDKSSTDQFLSVLKDVLAARSLHGSAVRALTVKDTSDYSPLSDEQHEALSQLVQDLEWKKL